MFNRKKKGGNPFVNDDDECRVCRGRGGHWARNTRTGRVRAQNCAGCNRPPKSSPPS